MTESVTEDPVVSIGSKLAH